MLSINHTSVVYPYLNRRVYAAFVDGLLLVLGMVLSVVLAGPHNPPPWVYFSLCALVSLIEPVLVSFTGGSIGHHIFGIKVIDQSSGNHIGVVRSLVRTILRFMLGVFSLFFIHTTKRYQALHDLATKSLVIIRNTSSLPARHYRKEQSLEEPLYRYPSLWRRGAIICIYSIISIITLVAISALFVTETCLLNDNCSEEENVIVVLVDLVILVTLAPLMIFGVKGRLWGAKRKKLISAKA